MCEIRVSWAGIRVECTVEFGLDMFDVRLQGVLLYMLRRHDDAVFCVKFNSATMLEFGVYNLQLRCIF